jgi:dTDP-4-dehydrorhamnose reductase
MASAIEECCHARRLRVCPAAPDKMAQLLSQMNAWAAISVEEAGRTAGGWLPALRCHFPGGAVLDLEAPAAIGMAETANAFLDLVVDGQTGTFRLLRAEPNNQYWLEAVAEEESGPGYAA